jgi:serine/threonine protein kinase/Tfp pilus assembly protein PilF
VSDSIIGRTLSHYRIAERLGAGGMGEVYLALDTKLHRNVALKLLLDSAADPNTLQRLEREAQSVAALNHPNIVTIYSVEAWEGTHFITMELIEGKTLGNVIPRGGLSMDDFFELVVGVADALIAAHQRGVIHRDLKPANIMVTKDGRAKVLDFGLAKVHESVDSYAVTRTTNQFITEAGTMLGTIPYMSPEQLKAKKADQRSDVFSLGVVLYEMCTGTRPFRAESSAEMISSILRDSPTPVSELNRQCPQGLARIVGRCLEKDPAQRYQTVVELRSDLLDVQSGIHDGTANDDKTSIAVLSFSDMSQEKSQQYFCDGLAEELINALTKITGLKVAARSSAFAYSGTGVDVREIGTKLSVDTVLEGSVRKSGNRLRITAQLINVGDGYHLWSEQYDREMKDIFAIQDEIAQQIVQSLELALTPEEKQISPRPGTQDPQAYDYYLRGRKLFYQHLRKGFELALQMFTKAIEQDPKFAKAYSGIADCCYFLNLYYDGGEASLRRADDASRQAVELGPDMAEPHASRGGVLSLLGKHDEAEVEFETAIRLGPELFEAYYLYARDCYTQGNLERAASLYGRAAEVDSDDFQSLLLLAQVCDDLGRPAPAETARRRGIEIIKQRLLTNPDDVRALYLGANGLVELGQQDKCFEWTALALSIAPDDSYVLYNVACIYSIAGKLDEALDFIDRTIQSGLTKPTWLDRDSNLDSLRALPRFQALRDKLK